MKVIVLDKNHQEFNGKRYGLHVGNRYYKRTKSENGKKTTVHLHREVWEYHNGSIPEGMVIDHIDRDKSNNDIANLRLTDWKGNRANISDEHREVYRQNIIAFNSQDSGKWWQTEEGRKRHSEMLSKRWANTPKKKKKCLLCDSIFYAKHGSAVYCSKECRQQNYFRNGIKRWQQKKITK